MDLEDGDPDLQHDHPVGDESPRATPTNRASSLPLPILAINAIYSACFQIPMLPLLHILNTRVAVPAKYLPAYGAIAFLPLCLRPLISFCTSKILDHVSLILPPFSGHNGKSKHERLLAPVLCFGILSLLGTNSIPANGIVACFVWGFIRGIVNAWLDFLLGMVTVELAQSISDNNTTSSISYEDAASFLTAQSRTALNAGTLVSSLFTFFFYLVWDKELDDHSVSFLLSATACLYGTAAILAIWHQKQNIIADASSSTSPSVNVAQYSLLWSTTSAAQPHQQRQNKESYEYIIQTEVADQHDRHIDDSENCSSSPQLFDPEETVPSSAPNDFETFAAVSSQQQQALLESFALVMFQLILATTALQQLIVSFVGTAFWSGLLTILLMLLAMILLFLWVSSSSSPTALSHGQLERAIPYYRLHLYFLLRNAVPSSTTVIYSFQYTVFAAEPVFLQVLSLCGSAVGTLATLFYERFLAKYNRGWSLILLIGTLNVASGLAGLLDLVVIRSVVWHITDSGKVAANVTVPLRYFIVFVEIAQSFFGELDNLPTAILSTSNVRNTAGNVAMQSDVMTSGDDGRDEDTCGISALSGSWNPSYNSGMQYASFLSSIDFGFQVAEWITIPMMASLHVTRENNWANVDTFVIVCCIFQISRLLLLWLLRPTTCSLS